MINDMRRRFFINSEIAFDTNNYLTIRALEDGLSVSFTRLIEYGIDGIGWNKLNIGESTKPISAGQTISFKGELMPFGSGVGTFTISNKCNLEGNCMSILFGDNAVHNLSLYGKEYAFTSLFESCSQIIEVDKDFLPATTLVDYCYDRMFQGCTSLTSAPKLPATTLADNCYESMFCGCTSLRTAPELPATTLVYACYNTMFYNCTSLQTPPELPATTLANVCYRDMFHSCTSLTTAPELPATVLASNCYASMFQNCASLTAAPELPATTLTNGCYNQMFYMCTNLKYIKMLATDISASGCLSYWVYGVVSSGTFVKNVNMNNLTIGSSGIPIGWTVQNA